MVFKNFETVDEVMQYALKAEEIANQQVIKFAEVKRE